MHRKSNPDAYARVSNISGTVRGVFQAGPNGEEPDVELQTERLVPLFRLEAVVAGYESLVLQCDALVSANNDLNAELLRLGAREG